MSNLRDLKIETARGKPSGSEADEPGYIHIDVKYLPPIADQTSCLYLFVAIARATCWVFVCVYNRKSAGNVLRFLHDLDRTYPLRIRTTLTDNGKEFPGGPLGRAPSGKYEFDNYPLAGSLLCRPWKTDTN